MPSRPIKDDKAVNSTKENPAPDWHQETGMDKLQQTHDSTTSHTEQAMDGTETGYRHGYCAAVSVALNALGAVLPVSTIVALAQWRSDLEGLWLASPRGEAPPPPPVSVLTFDREIAL
jgi:hypothetical protein